MNINRHRRSVGKQIKTTKKIANVLYLTYVLYGQGCITWQIVMSIISMYSAACILTAMTLSGAKKGRHTWQEFSRCTRLGGLLTRHVSVDAATLEAISFTSTSTNAVYLIASLHHDGWYVGQTKDMTRRTREHFLATVKSQMIWYDRFHWCD